MKNSRNMKIKPENSHSTIKELGCLLGQDYTIDIILLLSKEPMRNKEIKKNLKCKDNTLSRRLHGLINYGIIKKLPVMAGNKRTHEYSITEKGQEILSFFKGFNRKI